MNDLELINNAIYFMQSSSATGEKENVTYLATLQGLREMHKKLSDEKDLPKAEKK